MLSFLDKLNDLIGRHSPDAEIVGEVRFHDDSAPYFTVRMKGCKTLVDINAEDIVEKLTNKFTQNDIKNATKAFIKYRSLLRLASIEKNFAILYNNKDHSYQLIDLSDNLFLHNLDMDALRPEDAFKLGVHFERTRLEKDRKLFNLSKTKNNITHLTLVESDH
jgi:hypothetical protein